MGLSEEHLPPAFFLARPRPDNRSLPLVEQTTGAVYPGRKAQAHNTTKVKVVKAKYEAGLENRSDQDLLPRGEDIQGNIPLEAFGAGAENGLFGCQA